MKNKYPFWTTVHKCVESHKDLFEFYKDGIKTGPERIVRIHCMQEYNKYKAWGF